MRKLIVITLMVSFLLVGCGKKDQYAEKSSIDSNERTKIVREFNRYRGLRIEAADAWYDELLQPFNTEIALTGGYVNKAKIKEGINKIDMKIVEINRIEQKDLDKYYDYIYELKSKNESDNKELKDYNDLIEHRKKDSKKYMGEMKKALGEAKSALESGMDGRFDPKEAQHIRGMEVEFLKTFE